MSRIFSFAQAHRLLPATLLSLAGLASASADPRTEANAFIEAAKQWSANLASLECRIEWYERDSPNATVVLDWSENIQSYRFTCEGLTEKGLRNFWSSAASGPDSSMYGVEQGKYIYVQKTRKPIPPEVRIFPLPVALFDFIINDGTGDPWDKPGLGALRSEKIWDSLRSRLTYVGPEKFNGKDAIAFDVQGGNDKISGVPIRYRIYTDPSRALFPFACEIFDKSGQCLYSYEVTDAKPAKVGALSILFPAEVKVKYFTSKAGVVQSEPRNWQTIRYKNVVLNTIPDDLLQLDPSSADMIRDLDTKVNIPVPK